MIVVFKVREEELFEALEKLEKLFHPRQITEVERATSLGSERTLWYTIIVSTAYDPPELLRRLKEHGLLEYLACIKR
ncbi:MAG: hypothetical protein DRP01_11385 [Archaeoglobales archaeon]|nr:MAG: hypothetical protein DRP01_11385 [Archaeoglobales archaeon]